MGMEQIPVTALYCNPSPINRAQLEAMIADAIELLDVINGDPDLKNLDPDD